MNDQGYTITCVKEARGKKLGIRVHRWKLSEAYALYHKLEGALVSIEWHYQPNHFLLVAEKRG